MLVLIFGRLALIRNVGDGGGTPGNAIVNEGGVAITNEAGVTLVTEAG